MSQETEGQVVEFDHATWLTMKTLKRSIGWYEQQMRDNDKFGTARRKEKKLLRDFIKEGYAASETGQL